MQIQSNLGKNTEINKQLHVKFWFNRKKNGAVSYLLSCATKRANYFKTKFGNSGHGGGCVGSR
jgi:hypothetical protein